MTLQDSLSRIEELLRGLRNTNPRPKEVWKAWEAVTNTCGRCEGRCQSLGIPREQRGTAQAIKWQETGDVKYLWDIECPECFGTGRIIRDISDWPDDAVRGLLIGIAFDLDIVELIARKLDVGAPMSMLGHVWHAPLADLSTELIAALEERAK